jgi:hypothetical protein
MNADKLAILVCILICAICGKCIWNTNFKLLPRKIR